MHNMGKTIGELYALLIEYDKGLPKKAATPQVMAIQGGRIQKANKKLLNAKGKDKGKGKRNDKLVYIPKPKNPKPFAKEHPKKDDACHHYKEVGHWKRNYPVYLAELIKKKKQVGTASSSVSKNDVLYFNAIPSNGIYEIDMINQTATRILNMVLTKKVDKTPYELWYGKVPNLSYLKVWGCEALVKRDTLDKLQQRSVKFVARYAEFLEKNLISQEVSGRAVELEEIQDKDTSPSENTSEIPMEEKEAKNTDTEIALEKKVKELDNVETNVISIADSEETLMLEKESQSKMLLKQSDPMVLEKKAPRELPKVSLVNTSLKKLKYHLGQFDNVMKKRITPDALTEGEWGFEHTKAIFLKEIIPFVKILKDIFNVFDKDLLNEKQFLIENDRLLDQIISQDIVVNSSLDINTSVNVNSSGAMNDSVNYIEMCNKCLELEAELIKQHNMVEKDEYNRLLKSFSKLEQHCISLELAMQLNKEIFQKNNTFVNQTEPSFDQFVKKDIDETETINIELEHRVTKLIAKNEHLKQTYKQLYDSIKPSCVRAKEHAESLVNQLNQKAVEITDLNAQLQEKLDPVTLAPKDKNNRETHIYYLKHTMEQDAILRKIVEQAKSLNPLNSASYSACKYVKLIQEFLGYVRDTCPDIHKPSEKLVVVTPINKKKTVSWRKKSSQREIRPIWNNVQRVNHQNQFVPTAVLTRTGKIPVSTTRASGTNNVSTARHNFNSQAVLTNAARKISTVKPVVNRVRPKTVFHKTHSPFSRPFNNTTALRTNFSYQKVNTAEVNAVSAVGGKGNCC
ncbi:hypothetical protein Tco_1337050 [Tanacetum coccineum]